MKSRLPWRMHNPTGWAERIAASGVRPLEEWSLLRLLDAQWLLGSIPDSPSAVLDYLVFLGLDRSDRKRIRAALLLDFFPEKVGESRRRNPAVFAEWERADFMRDAMSNKARAAAEERWRRERQRRGGGDASGNTPSMDGDA